MNIENIKLELNKKFEEKRRKAERELSSKKDFVVKNYPEFSALLLHLNTTNINLIKAEQSKDNNSALKLIEERKILNKKINEFLTLKGYKKGDFTPKYECPICRDSGKVGKEYCSCYKNALVNAIFENLEITPIPLENFSSYDCVNETSKEILPIMQEYCNKFPDTKTHNFLFSGGTGVGKTFLSKCVADKLLGLGFSVVFLNAFSLNSIFKEEHKLYGNKESSLEILTDCDMLIIDDLGSEPIYKNVTLEYLLSVIFDRLDKNKHTIITTNLTVLELKERYGERLFSRLLDKSKSAFISFKGKDLRLN